MRNQLSVLLSISSLCCAVYAQSRCVIEPAAVVSDTCVSYSDLETLNDQIATSLEDVTQTTDFFAYYRLNLYNKLCPYWTDEQSLCGNRACAVDTIEDEKDVPAIWRADELSKLQGARAEHPGPALQKKRPKERPLNRQLGDNVDESCVLEDDDECDERDYCVPEDEGAASKGDYVSLVDNSERFTGYSGPGAWQVWDAIYKENCFGPVPEKLENEQGKLHAARELRDVFEDYERNHLATGEELLPIDDRCLEQRAFYRIISGMHASISAHLCWDFFNQTTGEWVQNLQCYKERLHEHSDRVSNLYFNYALVSRAVAKLRKHLEHYTFCSGDPEQDLETREKVVKLTKQVAAAPTTFDESVMFKDPGMMDLKDDFKIRFRNVSRLMDCVGCDRCRLWGKVQTAGYGAALKVLFEFDETKNGENPHLRRTELVALINTFGRISHSLKTVQKFEDAIVKEAASKVERGSESQAALPSAAIPEHRKDTSFDRDSVDDGFDDLEDEESTSSTQIGDQGTVMQAFTEELDLVWRTYKMVLRSWVNLPFTLSSIAVMELNRLWNYWLGLPVPGRSWNFHFPTRDEL